jgi:hypothetical protein
VGKYVGFAFVGLLVGLRFVGLNVGAGTGALEGFGDRDGFVVGAFEGV